MKELEKYINGYIKKHEVTIDEALTHSVIRNVAEYYEVDLEELKEVVDGYPAFMEMLQNIPMDDDFDEGVDI